MAIQQPSYWWQLLYELFKWKPVGHVPFRRSVAFLAGVSHYNRISQQLDFVKTDLTELRNFLLTDGGFDVVYEVRDGNVTHQVIEQFMAKHFSDPRGPVSPEDRLLVYYSGHGGAQADVEPYLLFQNANPPDDYTDALPVRDVYRWSRTIVAKHLLIILDACFSGLAQDKSGPDDRTTALSNALAGEPSGLLLTAGTGDERAYAIQYSKEKNGSIFTHALIDALLSMSKTEGIVTIGQAFERAKVTVAAFDAVANKKMTPLPTPLARRGGFGKGNFIFINPRAENPNLPLGIYGGQQAITKAPDYVDPNLTLIQKEYDEVKSSENISALRAFDTAYKGKPFGQALVYLIEERINRIEHPRWESHGWAGRSSDLPPQPSVKQVEADLMYLSTLTKAQRLLELRGDVIHGLIDSGEEWNATFVARGAETCQIGRGILHHGTSVRCVFSTKRFLFGDLFAIVKSTFPELGWVRKTGDLNGTIVEDASGSNSSLRLRVYLALYIFAKDQVSLTMYQAP